MSVITTTALAALLTLVPLVNGHIGVFHPSMFCANGPQNEINWNSNTVVGPMYQLDFSDYWFGNGKTNGVSNHCYNWPPPANQFLELPAGGSFEVEFASNRAFTSMSQGGSKNVGVFPDGQAHPDYDQPGFFNPACVTSPLLHTQDRKHVAGSVFAISYHSDYASVTPENMVVFSANYDTPWHSKGTFMVPADMPACPPGGCLCGWGWLPNNCGQPNQYFQLFRCKVTGAKANAPKVDVAKPAVWCEDHPEKCTKGAKQMIIWHQNERNNIAFTGTGRAGEQDDLQQFSPGYNSKMGFPNGAQNDIFVKTSNQAPVVVPPKPSSTIKPTSTAVKPSATHTSSKKPIVKPSPKPSHTSHKSSAHPSASSHPAPHPVVISKPPPSNNASTGGKTTKPKPPCDEKKPKHKPVHKHKHKEQHKSKPKHHAHAHHRLHKASRRSME